MNVKKGNVICRNGLVAALVVSALAAPQAMANEEDKACASLLCLAGEMIGGSGGGECAGPIADYFSIVKFKKGDFSPSRTAKARGSYLNQCTSDKSGTAQRVNGKYGRLLGGI